MAQILPLKIGSTGKPTEVNSSTDDITFASGQFGNVKASGNSVISTDTNGNLNMTPNGTGDLVLDGVKWPQADGSSGQILKTNGSAQTSWVDPYAATLIDSANFVAAVGGVTALDCVYISAAGTVAPAKADAESTSRAIGFATNTALVTAAVNVQMDGVLSGFSGLTAGARYYLDKTTAGQITSTLPTGTAVDVLQVGFAAATTKLKILFQDMGIRA